MQCRAPFKFSTCANIYNVRYKETTLILTNRDSWGLHISSLLPHVTCPLEWPKTTTPRLVCWGGALWALSPCPWSVRLFDSENFPWQRQHCIHPSIWQQGGMSRVPYISNENNPFDSGTQRKAICSSVCRWQSYTRLVKAYFGTSHEAVYMHSSLSSSGRPWPHAAPHTCFSREVASKQRGCRDHSHAKQEACS